MTLLEVEGVYRDGKVELAKIPEGVQEARVRVIFLPAEDVQEPAAPPEAQEERRRAAMQRLFARLEQGIDFGGPPYPHREELYDRVNRHDSRDG